MNIDFDRLLGYLDELVDYRRDEDVDTANLERFIGDIEAIEATGSAETERKKPARTKSPKKIIKDRPIRRRTKNGCLAR